MAKNYHLKNIRTLLAEGFTDEELRRLCYDIPDFRAVYDRLTPGISKGEVIDQLVEYADRKLQLELLLSLVKEYNPARYEKHQPYYYAVLDSQMPEAAEPKFLNSKVSQMGWLSKIAASLGIGLVIYLMTQFIFLGEGPFQVSINIGVVPGSASINELTPVTPTPSPTPVKLIEPTSTATITAAVTLTSEPPTPRRSTPEASPTPAPTSTSTPTPTSSPTSTFTPTPTLLPTSSPSSTPLLKATATPTLKPLPTMAPSISPLTLAHLKGKILFRTDRAGFVQIYQMDADGRNARPLADESLYLEALAGEATSPDKQQSLIVRIDGNADIWYIDYKNNREWRVTYDAHDDYDPTWSPTGEWIAYTSDRSGSGDIYVSNPLGFYDLRITPNEGVFDKHPSFSPDGRQLVYWSNAERGMRQIWLADLDLAVGSAQLRNLSDNPYNDWDPIWVK